MSASPKLIPSPNKPNAQALGRLFDYILTLLATGVIEHAPAVEMERQDVATAERVPEMVGD